MKSNNSPELQCSMIIKSSFSVSIIYEGMFKGNLYAYLVELDHIGVSDFLKDLNLPGDSLNIFVVLYHLFLENFHGHLNATVVIKTCSCYCSSSMYERWVLPFLRSRCAYPASLDRKCLFRVASLRKSKVYSAKFINENGQLWKHCRLILVKIGQCYGSDTRTFQERR